MDWKFDVAGKKTKVKFAEEKLHSKINVENWTIVIEIREFNENMKLYTKK